MTVVTSHRLLVPIEFGEITLTCRNQFDDVVVLPLTDFVQGAAGPTLRFDCRGVLLQAVRLKMILLTSNGPSTFDIKMDDDSLWADANLFVPLIDPWVLIPNEDTEIE